MASSVITKNFKKELFQGTIDLDNDIFYIALLNNTSAVATSAFENMINFSDAQVYETSGAGYTSGGKGLSGNAISLNVSTAIWDCNDVTWPASTITADGCVIYKLITNINDSPIVAYFSLGGVQSSNNGDFILQVNSQGLLNLVS